MSSPQNHQERRIFSAAPAKEGIGGAYSFGLLIGRGNHHIHAVHLDVLHDGLSAVDGVLMIRIHAVRAMRSGIDKMQAELTVVAVIGDILRAVGLTVDRAEELTRARRNHHRAALVADGVRRGHTVDFAQRRRIRRSQRLGVVVVAGGTERGRSATCRT